MMGKPIRILHIVTSMNMGGLETMIMNYYRNINRNIVQFDFLTHRKKEGVYDQEIKSLGGKIYYISRLNPFSPIYKKDLNDFFEKHKHEYKIVHSHLDCMSYYPLKVAMKKGILVRIAHAHSNNQDKDFKYLIKIYSKKKILSVATSLFACSNQAGEWTFGNNSNFKILKNAIQSEKYLFDYSKAESLRKKLNLENKIIIGHIGRFSEAKNHTFLLEIFKEIVKLNDNVVLLLIGEGKLFKTIQYKVNELNLNKKVVFIGQSNKVQDYLMCMDVFILPSLYEGLGIVLIEAQTSGLPCLVSKNVVPLESKITNLVKFIPLSYPAQYWAKEALNLANQNNIRYSRKSEIIAAEYDIIENSKKLERYYLREHQNG